MIFHCKNIFSLTYPPFWYFVITNTVALNIFKWILRYKCAKVSPENGFSGSQSVCMFIFNLLPLLPLQKVSHPYGSEIALVQIFSVCLHCKTQWSGLSAHFYLTASEYIIPSLKHNLHKASKTPLSPEFDPILLVKLSELLLLDSFHFPIAQFLSYLRYNFSSVSILTFCMIPTSSMVFTTM